MGRILSTLGDFISVVNVADIIDVLIVAYVIYTIMKFLSETRGMQLLRGIILILVALWLSEALQLNTVNFILRNAMQVGIIAILIIFQPELRRGLERVGRTSFVSVVLGEMNSIPDLIGRICSACGRMSSSKTGALIVIEQDVKLGEYIGTGTTLNADISSELIENIFFKNSPLHDGALIIREDKIVAAGCYLRLTQNDTLSRDLGTRHRAAVGLSEVSDAIVIVVSEETGTISLAMNGTLKRHLSEETLMQNLLKYMHLEEKEDSGIIKKWKGLLSWKK